MNHEVFTTLVEYFIAVSILWISLMLIYIFLSGKHSFTLSFFHIILCIKRVLFGEYYIKKPCGPPLTLLDPRIKACSSFSLYSSLQVLSSPLLCFWIPFLVLFLCPICYCVLDTFKLLCDWICRWRQWNQGLLLPRVNSDARLLKFSTFIS